MIGKKKLRIIIPAAVALLLLIIVVLVIVGKDAIIDLLTPDTQEERNLIYLVLTIAGLVVLYLNLKHIDVKKKKKSSDKKDRK